MTSQVGLNENKRMVGVTEQSGKDGVKRTEYTINIPPSKVHWDYKLTGIEDPLLSPSNLPILIAYAFELNWISHRYPCSFHILCNWYNHWVVSVYKWAVQYRIQIQHRMVHFLTNDMLSVFSAAWFPKYSGQNKIRLEENESGAGAMKHEVQSSMYHVRLTCDSEAGHWPYLVCSGP